MTTPPKPSPEAVAAAADINRVIALGFKERIPEGVTFKNTEVLATELDRHFAPIIAKAELCDRLAAALRVMSSFPMEGFQNRHKPDAPVYGYNHWYMLVKDVYHAKQVMADYEATTRAAGPADAGGGRENQ